MVTSYDYSQSMCDVDNFKQNTMTSIDFTLLKKKLIEAIEKETPESLNEWLKGKPHENENEKPKITIPDLTLSSSKVYEIAMDAMNLGMTLRQSQINGLTDKSGSEVLAIFMSEKFNQIIEERKS